MDLSHMIRKFKRRFRKSPEYSVSFLKHFSYKDIKKATDGFNRVIYTNPHHAAYKGKFRNGRVVMVKEIKSFRQEKDGFYKELQMLGQLHHRHLLGLKGYSMGEKSLRFLVFDNIENGSLKEHLNDPLRTPLDWRTRMQIAAGVVAALEYLLLFNEPPVSHVSISSSNIMLDENFNAKLADVGLTNSRGNFVAVPHSSCSKDCMDQECGNIIFQLGVLILELITGQSSEKGCADLVQWIQGSQFGSSVHRMIDPDLGNAYNSQELKHLLSVARYCIKSRNKTTASFAQIFRYLQKKLSLA